MQTEADERTDNGIEMRKQGKNEGKKERREGGREGGRKGRREGGKLTLSHSV